MVDRFWVYEMRKLKVKILIILLLVGGVCGYSQQHPLADMYMLDHIYINPAYTGTTIRIPVIISTRQQWVQIAQGPSTQAFSIHKRIRKGSIKFNSRGFLNRGYNSAGNVGLGGFVFNDKSGAMSRTGIQLNYAYHIPLENARLALGIGTSIFHYSILTSGLHLPTNITDPAIESARETTWMPDAHVGAFFYNEYFFIGASVNQLFESSVIWGNKEAFDSESGEYDVNRIRQYYIEGGYKFDLSNSWEMEPSLLFKTTEKANSRLDINMKVIYDKKYWVGFSYRTKRAIYAMLGIKFENLVFGYCYEQELSDIRSYNFNSHQIMVGLRIGERLSGQHWR